MSRALALAVTTAAAAAMADARYVVVLYRCDVVRLGVAVAASGCIRCWCEAGRRLDCRNGVAGQGRAGQGRAEQGRRRRVVHISPPGPFLGWGGGASGGPLRYAIDGDAPTTPKQTSRNHATTPIHAAATDHE
jgi:hypothetical protein